MRQHPVTIGSHVQDAVLTLNYRRRKVLSEVTRTDGLETRVSRMGEGGLSRLLQHPDVV